MKLDQCNLAHLAKEETTGNTNCYKKPPHLWAVFCYDYCMQKKGNKRLIMRLGILALLLVLFVSFARSSKDTVTPISFTKKATIGDVQISLGVAKSEKEHEMGLSYQKELGFDQGLLFLFEDTIPHGIWMKKMNFPIDVLWLSDTGTILYIKEAFSPDSYPEVVSPKVPASMVLELSSGFVRRHQIGVGDQVIFLEKEL